METNNTIKKEIYSERGSFSKIKRIIIIILLILVFIFGIYLYFWIRSTQKIQVEAKNTIENAIKYNILKEKIEKEKSRCENFISQQEGDFGSFEYCKKFIDWEYELKNNL